MGAAIVCCGHKSYIASLLLFNNFVFVGRRKGNVRKAGNEQRRGLYDYEQGIVPIILLLCTTSLLSPDGLYYFIIL